MEKEEAQRQLLTLLGNLFSELSVVSKELWKDYAYDFFAKLENDDAIKD